MTDDSRSDVGRLLRDLAPQVLGAVARRYPDFAAAEDAVQEALIAAAVQWPTDGVPRNARGWLYHVAMRRMTDHIRSEASRRRREDAVAAEPWAGDAFAESIVGDIDARHDDSLALLFMCCHPALTIPTAIALTLRAVGGLTTAEIASAFMVPQATMAQRISRAKQSIRDSDIPFALPSADQHAERLAAVLHVLYLIFNEGYTSSGSHLQRTDLSREAIRLARLLHDQLPEDPEVEGLLALLLLTDARRDARTGPHGELIPLDEQDRTRWDRDMIAEGEMRVASAMSRGLIGPYQVQAAIAAVHDDAAHVDETDWPQIVALYDVLEGMADNPMVSLNRAVAVAMVDGPDAGLARVDEVAADRRIDGHYRIDAVRAHLLERTGECARAVEHYRAAAARTPSTPERDYLNMRAARLADSAGG